jgi:hypothetical protein
MILEIPCKKCIAFAMCKSRCNVDYVRGDPSLTAMIEVEKCEKLNTFMSKADMDDVNEGRILFGLQPYK